MENPSDFPNEETQGEIISLEPYQEDALIICPSLSSLQRSLQEARPLYLMTGVERYGPDADSPGREREVICSPLLLVLVITMLGSEGSFGRLSHHEPVAKLN